MVLSNQHDHQPGAVAVLNDAFRTSFLGGTVCVTAAVHEKGAEFVKAALAAVRDFSTFDGDNDPYGEHDFGSLTVEGQKLYWKIDYFDPSMLHHAPDPADRETTRRVLTILFPEEY
jgi:hypothetical protein